MSFNPKCNQTNEVAGVGANSAAAVAKRQQAKFAKARAQQRRLEEAAAKAEAMKAKGANERASRTREATRANLFWNNVQNPEPEQGEQE